MRDDGSKLKIVHTSVATVVRLQIADLGSWETARLRCVVDEVLHATAESSAGRFVLDATAVTRLGAEFLNELVRLHDYVRDRGLWFIVVARGVCFELIALSRLDSLFPVVSTLDQALSDPLLHGRPGSSRSLREIA
ncbi:MAG: hypothetical protein WD066_03605 [Planctomycetaceae bacterium]